MLQSIRDGSRSWGAKIIIGVMVAAMAFFGIESLFGLFGSDPNEVASVNGQPIMRQQVELEVQRALRSGQVPPEQERALRSDMLDQLITQQLLSQYAKDGGFSVSDEQLDQMIVGLPEFHDQDGRFSADVFRNRLAGAGYTPMLFRDELRVDIQRQHLQQGLAFSEFSAYLMSRAAWQSYSVNPTPNTVPNAAADPDRADPDRCCSSPLELWRPTLHEREATYMAESRDRGAPEEDVAGGGYQEVALR